METQIKIGDEKFDIFNSQDRKLLLQKMTKLCNSIISPDIEFQSRIGKKYVEKLKTRIHETVRFIRERILDFVEELKDQLPKKILRELDNFFLKIEKLEKKLQV
jgi:hypothetical protein